MTFKQYLPWFLARLFLGGLFLTAGFFKLIEPVENFRGMIAAYGVVPYAWIGPVAHILPWFELIPGLALVTGYLPRQAAALLGLLAFSFIGLIALAQLNGTLPEQCGCFGEGLQMTPYQMAILDALNVLIALKLASMREHRAVLAV